MSNFQRTFNNGRIGLNFGITTGLKPLDKAINGIQKKTSIGVAAAPKCGKTTFVDFCFLLSPYLYMLENNRLSDIEWIYFSLEVDRVSKEFKIAAFFMFYDYNIFDFEYKGKTYLMNKEYLMGKQKHYFEDGTEETMLVSDEHAALIREIFTKRIVPLFGKYDENGNCIQKGKVTIIDVAENPTGMDKFVKRYAESIGRFIKEKYTVVENNKSVIKEKVVGYRPNNPNLRLIIITDHIRKPQRERGFTMKENIDKWLEYTTTIRNRCEFIFINICHSNRGISNIERLRFAKENIFPTADDIKDTGNLAEESTVLMTLFNPNDEKYNLKEHMGVKLEDYPNYRSLHITESRDTESPVHIQLNMYGNVNYFKPL